MINGIPDGFHFLYYSLFSKNLNRDIFTFKRSVNIAFTSVFPLKKQYLCTFEYFIQIKTSGKTHCKLFHYHFCLNIRFLMYFRLGASLRPVEMAAV